MSLTFPLSSFRTFHCLSTQCWNNIKSGFLSLVFCITNFSFCLYSGGLFLSNFCILVGSFGLGSSEVNGRAFYWPSNFCSLVTAVGCNWSRSTWKSWTYSPVTLTVIRLSLDCHWVSSSPRDKLNGCSFWCQWCWIQLGTRSNTRQFTMFVICQYIGCHMPSFLFFCWISSHKLVVSFKVLLISNLFLLDLIFNFFFFSN